MSTRKIKAVVFSGGRGAASISGVLSSHAQVDLTVLVNAYDDGLSTGRLRGYLPGMLGPSDIRKNISTLMPRHELCYESLDKLLDYRLALDADRGDAYKIFSSIIRQDLEEVGDSKLATYMEHISVGQLRLVSRYITLFCEYEESRNAAGEQFDFNDCSLGNIVFAGCYLSCDRDFNAAVEASANLCDIDSSILNVTDGENFVLLGIRADGQVLFDEAQIVSPQDASHVEEIFLLKDYLSEEKKLSLSSSDKESKIKYLRESQVFPEANIAALDAIQHADLIVYGPGTQFSSLFPSYLTVGVAEAIASNKNAEKIFVSNIVSDHDINGLSAEHLFDQLIFHMSRKGAIRPSFNSDQLVTQSFVQSADETDLNRTSSIRNYVPLESGRADSTGLHARDWELGEGKHGGGLIVSEMLQLVQHLIEVRIQPYRHMITIVVPVLNEVATIEKTLANLNGIDFGDLQMNKEIIVVDGGSTDGTSSLISEMSNIKSYKLAENTGRGAAIRLGFSKARGNILVIFPADDEYEAMDILSVAGPIAENRFDIVFGSRMIKCLDLSRRIRDIYGKKNYSGHLISKYGGISISICSLLLFNRFISDPFSTLKAYDANLIKAMNLSSDGLDLEGEIIAKAGRLQRFILEVPVDFKPRSRSEGKKTTLLGGLSTLAALFLWKYKHIEIENAEPREAS